MEKPKLVVKSNHSQVLRDHHNELCKVFNCVADEVLLGFSGELYSKHIIDRETKIAVSRKKGYEGADLLMDRVEIKIDQSPTSLVIVLQVMAKVEILKHILEKIHNKRDATRLEAEDMETESSVFLWFILCCCGSIRFSLTGQPVFGKAQNNSQVTFHDCCGDMCSIKQIIAIT